MSLPSGTPCETCGIGFALHSGIRADHHWRAPTGAAPVTPAAAEPDEYQMTPADLIARRIVSSGISSPIITLAGAGHWFTCSKSATEQR